MLTKVEIINSHGQNLELPLDDYSAGYLVTEIEGLDPVKASISSSAIASMDGAQYHFSRRDTRNILITLDLVPDYVTTTVAGLRTGLYGFAMPKSEITLKIYIDDVYTYYTKGRVESLETSIFSKDPTAVISLLCFDPDFYAAEPVIFTGNSTNDYTPFVLEYGGSVPAGFVFRVNANHAIDLVSLHILGPDGEVHEFNFSNSVNPLGDTDILEVSTIPGSKYAYRTDAGVQTSALPSVTTGSEWIQLLPGINNVAVWIDEIPVPYEIEYTPKYGGI